MSTSHPVATWMPDLLVLVDHLRAREGELPLSPAGRGAAASRARPGARRAPGARPTTPRASTPRRLAKTDRPTATCPRCFMALPATGLCDNCD